MTTERKLGALGLSIPDINPSTEPKLNLSADGITKWRAGLPLADTGVAAKKIFMVLNELNSIVIAPKDRLAIVEQIREPLNNVYESLNKHFIELSDPINEQKIVIANLRQTLLSEMLDNYKLIIEELGNKSTGNNEDRNILVTSICRAFFYYNQVLITRYQLYSNIQANLWHEINLIYSLAKKNDLLSSKVPCIFAKPNKTTTIQNSYAHIALLAIADPYHWRQKDQSILRATTEIWSHDAVFVEAGQINDKQPGMYVIDLSQDAGPIAFEQKKVSLSNNCIGFSINKCIEHLKSILKELQEGEVKVKIAHHGDPEFALPAVLLNKLIKIWSQQLTRNETRFPIEAKIKIAFGMQAAHYYVNKQMDFNPHPGNLITPTAEGEAKEDASAAPPPIAELPVFEVMDEEESENLSSEGSDTIKASKEIEDDAFGTDEVENQYTLYDYNIENISPRGLCIAVLDKSFPPFQCGEVVVFKNVSKEELNWSVGAVRWIKRRNDEVYQIGIQLISPLARAAGMQFIRNDKPFGNLLRCLVLPPMQDLELPPMILTATMPLHSKNVMLYIENENPIPATLEKEIDASGMYYQYGYAATKNIDIVADDAHDAEKEKEAEKKKSSTEFDSIWEHL